MTGIRTEEKIPYHGTLTYGTTLISLEHFDFNWKCSGNNGGPNPFVHIS